MAPGALARAVSAASPNPSRFDPRDEGYELITRRLCLIKDTGHAGNLWGGNMLGWLDEAGGIYAAMKTANPIIVTKAFTEVDFRQSVNPGDTVEFWGRIARVGTSSIAVDICVLAWRPTHPAPWNVLSVTGVFVAIDDAHEKTPIVPR